MPRINAAVVTSFDRPPRYQEIEIPEPGEHELLVEVLAAGLHPRVRTGAAGAHYTSTGELPMIPGIDGVGRRPDGKRIYFVSDDHVRGTMADRALADRRRSLELPDEVDAAAVAATVNPAMSSWTALRRRVPIEPNQNVLILGATGNAGSMAVRVAKRLGAGQVVAAGRDRERLEALRAVGADVIVQLTEDHEATGRELGAACGEVDIALDYLWGEPAQRAIAAVLTARPDRSRTLNWIQIGAIAGPTLELASVFLRSADFRLQGNGQGAISARAYLAELPALIDEIGAGRIALTPIEKPLADVEQIWAVADPPGERTVLVP